MSDIVKDGVPRDVDLAIREYLESIPGILPPFIAVYKAGKSGKRLPTACDIAACSPAKMWNLLKEGKVRSVKRDGSRMVETMSLLRFLFASPESKLAPPKPKRAHAACGG
jgi:hypothetical protein